MNILITGGAGFIGSHAATKIQEHGNNVLVLDNFKTGKTSNLKGFRGHIELCDITDIELLDRKFESFKPSVVHHFAAQSAISVSEKDPVYDASVNILGTINLLRMAKKHGVIRFIFSSTSAVYSPQSWFSPKESSETEPSSPYGISKLAAENYIRASGIPHVIFRYGNVYGPRQVSIGENQLIARALDHFLKGHSFSVVGDGKQKRDFIYVDDVADAHLLVNDWNDVTGTFNLATGKSHSVNEVVSMIADIFGVPSYPWNHTRQQDPRGSVYINNWLIRTAISMNFTSLEDGLLETIKEANGNQNIHQPKGN